MEIKELLYQRYVVEMKSSKAIELELGLSRYIVRKLLKENGIQMRSPKDAGLWLAPFVNKPMSDETKEKISKANSGANNGMFGVTGKNHHHFLGGKKSWESGRKISASRKKKIIKELGGVCKKCQSTEKLTINHKIPWRVCRHHEIWNLEILCSICHFSGPNRLR